MIHGEGYEIFQLEVSDLGILRTPIRNEEAEAIPGAIAGQQGVPSYLHLS